MNAYTLATRAVIAEYAHRVLRPVIIVGCILLIIGIISSAYLIAAVSNWWWLLMFVVIIYGILGSVAWLIVRFTLEKIRPRSQTASQKDAVKQFINQLSLMNDTMGMTKFGLLLRIISDVTSKREEHTVRRFIGDSKDLKYSFDDVIRAFTKQ